MDRWRRHKPAVGGGRRQEQGTVMVEFALVFLLLFTVITLVAEGGILFAAWLGATNGAREGARFGAPCLNRAVDSCTEAQVQAVVVDRTNGFPGVFTVLAPVVSGGTVTVTVTANVSSVSPILGDLTVYGVSTMRLENQP